MLICNLALQFLLPVCDKRNSLMENNLSLTVMEESCEALFHLCLKRKSQEHKIRLNLWL